MGLDATSSKNYRYLKQVNESPKRPLISGKLKPCRKKYIYIIISFPLQRTLFKNCNAVKKKKMVCIEQQLVHENVQEYENREWSLDGIETKSLHYFNKN